ncbi:Eaa prophage protein [Enterobacter hormaechei]|nr:Eaa prophage protein [Enterobacter hormaechei]
MSTLTKEWLQQTIAELEEERDAVPGVVNVDAAMALAAMKLALESLEAKDKIPELRQVIYHFRDWNEGFPIERFKADYVISWMLANYPPAQPAAVSVPAAMEMDDDFDSAFEHGKAVGWNACRAAMLQGAEPVTTAYKLPEETGSSLQLRNLIRQRHAEWSQATFGDVGPVGPLKHLSKEALEAAEEPDDLSEWADMQFLLWDAQRRAGISDGEITAAMEEKLKVNMARQWPEPKDGAPRLHIKAAPQQEV